MAQPGREEAQVEFSTPTQAGEAQPPAAWRAIGAAVRGFSHENMDVPCQDALSFSRLPGGLLVVAVADGAGSACCSHLGAQAAVSETIRVLETELSRALPSDREAWKVLLQSATASARQAVLALVNGDGDSPRNYASTLTVAAAGPFGLAVGQIGDGAVMAAAGDGDYFAATRLQRGEYANETHFLVQDDALDHLAVEIFEQPVSALAVMSDGLIRLAFKLPEQVPYAPFFAPLFQFLSSAGDETEAEVRLAGFLASERVNARTDDDKTLVLAVWPGRDRS